MSWRVLGQAGTYGIAVLMGGPGPLRRSPTASRHGLGRQPSQRTFAAAEGPSHLVLLTVLFVRVSAIRILPLVVPRQWRRAHAAGFIPVERRVAFARSVKRGSRRFAARCD